MKVRSMLAAGALVAVVVLAGCSENEPRKLGSVTGSTVAPPKSAYRIGDVVKLADAEVVVHGFKDPFTLDAKKPAPGNRYVMIDAEVKNLSSGTQVLSTFAQFELKDAEGESYRPVPLPGLPAVGGTAGPGQSRRGNVTFEVPEGTQGFNVVFRNVQFGKGEAEIFLA